MINKEKWSWEHTWIIKGWRLFDTYIFLESVILGIIVRPLFYSISKERSADVLNINIIDFTALILKTV